MLAEPVFVGRDRELDQLRQYLNLVLEGHGKTVFVAGEAGSGKTRLVTEFLKIASERHVRTLTGWCMSKAAIPYFPFSEAFNHYFSSIKETRAESAARKNLGITGWLKGTKRVGKPSEPELNPEITKNITFAATTKALLTLASERPTLLLLEDLHWADSASIALIHYISRAITNASLLILGTLRPEEITPDPEGHPHPLKETMGLMNREGLYNEVQVSSLARPDVKKLTESMVQGEVESDFADKLAEESQGNPFFTVESVRMLHESGGLVLEGGEWRLSSVELGIPTKVRDVVLRRFSTLNPRQRRILDLASVVGEEFDPSLLGAILSLDKLQILEDLSGISRSALLVNPVDSAYRFSHAKLREVLYDELSPPLRREYHARIAEAIDNSGNQREIQPVNDLAYHYVQAGNKEKAVMYSLQAGNEALRRFSNNEAIKHFQYILNTVPEDSKYVGDRITALEGLGDAYSAMGLFEKSTKTYEKLFDMSEQGNTKLRALRKAMAASFSRGDHRHTLELAGRVEGIAASDRLEQTRIRMYKAWTIGHTGNPPEAIRELEDCIRVFEEVNSPLDLANTLTQVSVLHSFTGENVEGSLHALQRAVSIYEELKELRGQVESHFWLGMPYFASGRNQEALDTWAKTVEVGGKIGHYERMAWAEGYSSLLFESMYLFQDALKHSLKGLEYVSKIDSHYTLGVIYINLLMNYSHLGDMIHAEEYYVRTKKLFETVGGSATKTLQGGMLRSFGIYLAAKGEWDEAKRLFDESLEVFKVSAGSALHEAMARVDYGDALLRLGRIAEGKMQIREAVKLYRKLGNGTVIARLNTLFGETGENPVPAK